MMEPIDDWLLTGGGLSWNIDKFHRLEHIPMRILLYGWIENSCCQAGEHMHRFWIKLLRHMVNNHDDWAVQVFNIHRRDQVLKDVLRSLEGDV